MSGAVHLEDIINADSFHKIQDSMAEAADMAMLTVDFAGKPVTPHSRCSAFCTLVRSRPELADQCRRCDSRGGIESARLREPYVYLCHMGVLDFAVPIIIDGNYIGAIMAGQVTIANPLEAGELELLSNAATAALLKAEPDFNLRLEACRLELPVASLGRVRATARMMFQVCNYIVEEALLKMQLADRTAVAGADGANSPDPNRPRLDNPILKPAIDYIKSHYARPIGLDEMAALCRISPSYFSKLFNQHQGENFAAYVNRVRILRARELLLDSAKPITAIALQLGFEDSGYFDKVFKKLIGCTPREFRRRGQAVQYR
jgi:ligand-binding sensor protein/AraC-like DNA-binding protein